MAAITHHAFSHSHRYLILSYIQTQMTTPSDSAPIIYTLILSIYSAYYFTTDQAGFHINIVGPQTPSVVAVVVCVCINLLRACLSKSQKTICVRLFFSFVEVCRSSD
ncbi:hypothetical protein CPB86DRAFT_487792 [Serendipita vermifera]|nr:hypothetical protein CPB86DRAFT_487792 [Serendipita vermifera]